MEESRVPCLLDAVRQGFPYVVLEALQNLQGFFNSTNFHSMVTVYVLLSDKDNTTYVGMALNALARLKEHNAGKNRYSKGHLPWKIIFTEAHPDWATARVREKYLKSTAGKNWLLKYLAENGGITGSLPA